MLIGEEFMFKNMSLLNKSVGNGINLIACIFDGK